MPVNIGPKIGIDGEKEFRQNLNSISQQLKTLGTEMKAVTSAFDANDKSQENLANQSQVLTEQLSLQEKRIAEIQKALDHARSNYAENSNQVQRWQQAMNNAVAELNKTRSQLSKVQSEMDGTEDSTKDLTDALDDVGNASEKASGGLSSMTVAMGNLISSGIQAAASAVADLVSSLWNLDESTEEYRESQARLNAAFENSGLSTNSAEKAYEELYSVMGETDTAVEAAQQISLLADSEKDVEKWSRLAAGVVGQFGDALQPETFFESANETLKLGEATGAYTQMLDGAGVNVEEFNARLASCNTEQEKQAFLLETAESILGGAGEAYRNYAGDIISANESQAKMDESLAKIGQSVANVKNEFLEQFTPAISAAADQAAAFISNLDPEAIVGNIQSLLNVLQTLLPVIVGVTAATVAYKAAVAISTVIDTVTKATQGMSIAQAALNAVMNANPFVLVATLVAGLGAAIVTLWTTNDGFKDAVLNAWEAIKNTAEVVCTAVSNFFTAAWDKIKEIWNNSAIKDYFSSIWETIKGIFSVVKAVLSGNFSDAWEAIKGIFSTWKSFFQSRWNDLTSIFSKAFSWFSNIGRSIVDGIKNGISNAWNGLKNWFSGLLDNLFSSVEDNEEIHSPSKKYEKIGRYDAMGIGVGFSNEMRNVQRQIDRSMSGLVAPTMTYGVTAASTSSSSGDSIGASVGAAVRAALDGAAVYLNGRKVGNLITQQQNQTTIARGQSQAYI